MNASEGYRLVRRLGSGVGGPVYLAETAAGRVAIREFKPASEAGSLPWEQERARFLEAGRASKALKHPRIVPVLDVVDEAGDAFIVMEYEEGETLETALSARRFSPEEANPILRQAATALDYAHDHAVVHGDLKPSDIFLVPGNGVKVADFGTSPRAGRDSRGPMAPGLMHEYLSPERLRDSESVTARSDQYSLGAIAYRMYTGHAPDIQAPAGPQGATRLAEITAPSRIDPRLALEIDVPILRALDRDPEKRYGRCGEFYAALEAALIASGTSQQRRGSRPWIFAAVALLLILAVAGILVSRHKSTESSGAARVPEAAAPTPAQPLSTPSPAPSHADKRQPAVHPRQARIPVTRTPRPYEPPAQRQATPPPVVPVSRPPQVEQPRPPVAEPNGYTIEVFSRTHSIQNGSTFSFNDPVLGELGLGDLRVVVNGQPPARGRLQLEWSVDGIAVDARAVALKRIVEYGNEPSAGLYRLTLTLHGRPLQTFSFRITP
jgi:serine/threonine protein kinase